MSDQTAGTRNPDARVIARNVKARRGVCGLSASEAADRCGVSAGWVESLEEGAASWDLVSLSRLAWALEAPLAHLLTEEYDPSHPVPTAGADRCTHGFTPELAEMDEKECFARLALQGVGRIAPGDAAEPFVVPVNYLLDGRDIVWRTQPGALPSTIEGRAAFEVEELVGSAHLGWSVLVVGDAEPVRDEAEQQRLEGLGLTPWPGGDRPVWMRIRTDHVTGRRIAPTCATGDTGP